MNRILIITGKGGVGKSSVAASHAVESAREGKKTILISTDMAHNIADIFETPVGGQITQLFENLYGLELDPDLIMKEEFPDMNRSIATMFHEAGFAANKVAEEMIFPGFDDLFCLLKIGKIYESGEYERIIVDCAPTGETLSLLKLPELLAWYMEKFFPVGKTMVRILSPISKFKYHVELPTAEGMDEIQRMHRQLMELQNLLKNHEICSVRLVSTPEKMVVEETKRNYMYMNLYGYLVDGLFINRVLPEQIDNPFFQHWKDIQREYIEELECVFREIPIIKIPWYSHEIRGKKQVEALVEDIFDSSGILCSSGSMNSDSVSGSEDNYESERSRFGEDLFAVRAKSNIESYECVDGKYQLVLRIPGITRENVRVSCHSMDLDISLDNFQRRIPLPNALRGSVIEEVVVEGEILRVCFG